MSRSADVYRTVYLTGRDHLADSIKPERQSVQMSKITNDDLTWSRTGCFVAVPVWQQWASKG